MVIREKISRLETLADNAKTLSLVGIAVTGTLACYGVNLAFNGIKAVSYKTLDVPYKWMKQDSLSLFPYVEKI